MRRYKYNMFIISYIKKKYLTVFILITKPDKENIFILEVL